MEIDLFRRTAIGNAIPGDFQVAGKLFAFSLENASKSIPVGRYRVDLTISQRALAGELWTSDLDKRLPLVCDVPQRSGIRIHALNDAAESHGCIGLGRRLAGPLLMNSRAAVAPFIDLLDETLKTEAVWITVHAADEVNV